MWPFQQAVCRKQACTSPLSPADDTANPAFPLVDAELEPTKVNIGLRVSCSVAVPPGILGGFLQEKAPWEG